MYTLFIINFINNIITITIIIVIYLIGSSIIYRLSSGICGVRIIIQGVRILKWVPNTDTPVIY